jgi:O-succinylbenzoic acid--CoA ligase
MTWRLADLVAELAASRPRDLAVIDGHRRLTWAGLSGHADEIARSMRSRGVRAGHRVALDVPARGEAIAVLVALLRIGATVAPLPAGLTRREREAALEVLDPAAVVDGGVLASFPARAGTDDEGPEEGPESAAVVVLTSGTTGRPKGVVLSHRAMAASADAWLAALPPATGWAMPLGLGHVAGLGVVWRAVRDGVPVRVLPAGDPARLHRALRASPPPSHVSVVPPQLVRLLDASRDAAPPASLRAVLLGGGTIPPSLVERAVRAGWPVMPTYGLSEMGSGVTALRVDEASKAPGTAGRPLPGLTVSVSEPGRDGVGEIVVAGPSRSSGYLGESRVGATEPVRTGDLGRLDGAGRLVVVDRRTDRIVRGGENVDPGEVEAVLERHPAVAQAAVVARADAMWGQVPIAAVVLRPAAVDPDDASLGAHARAALAGFKVPVAWTRLDALPRTSSGKLRRDAVRALLAGGTSGELARPDGDAIGWRVNGSGPRHLLLLHGTLSTSQQLGRLAAALAAAGGFTVHSIDRRGAGTSRLADPRPLDVAVHLADLRAYLDARAIERAAIAGISFGGVLGLEAAARIFGRVESVVAYEPPYGLVGDRPLVAWFRRVARDTTRSFDAGGNAAAAETFLRHVAGDDAWDRLPERARDFLAREGAGALTDAALTGLDPRGLARIDVPVTIITGGASQPFYAPIADELARRIPNARRVRLDGLTHTSPITDPSAVVDALVSSLAPSRSAEPVTVPVLEPSR